MVVEAFPNWWTRLEWSNDRRTNTTAVIEETQVDVWAWKVHAAGKVLKYGTSTSQRGARAACRRFVRSIYKDAVK